MWWNFAFYSLQHELGYPGDDQRSPRFLMGTVPPNGFCVRLWGQTVRGWGHKGKGSLIRHWMLFQLGASWPQVSELLQANYTHVPSQGEAQTPCHDGRISSHKVGFTVKPVLTEWATPVRLGVKRPHGLGTQWSLSSPVVQREWGYVWEMRLQQVPKAWGKGWDSLWLSWWKLESPTKPLTMKDSPRQGALDAGHLRRWKLPASSG